jgi:CRP/FNR family transcriptional regulator, cyclic AMP receptor protein
MSGAEFLPEGTKESPLLVSLTDEALHQVLEVMVARRFDAGEVILRQDTVTHNVWVIVGGQCEVIKEPPPGRSGKPVKLAELGPAETFGEMSMFCDAPHCTSVWAATDVETLKLRRDDFERLVETHPVAACRLACNLVNLLSERIRRMNDWLGRLLDEHDAIAAEERWQNVRQRLQQKFQGYLV